MGVKDFASKTQAKAASDAVQRLGERLIALPESRLKQLDLDEKLLDAIHDAQKITAHEGLRRQRQYIGKLMRDMDVAPIHAKMALWEVGPAREKARFQQTEHWRDRMLNDPAAIDAFFQRHISGRRQDVADLIAGAKREQELLKPPKSARQLFRLVQEIIAQAPGGAQ